MDYRSEISIEQPKLYNPGKTLYAVGEWRDKINLKINSDLITITQLDEGRVIEQKGC